MRVQIEMTKVNQKQSDSLQAGIRMGTNARERGPRFCSQGALRTGQDVMENGRLQFSAVLKFGREGFGG